MAGTIASCYMFSPVKPQACLQDKGKNTLGANKKNLMRMGGCTLFALHRQHQLAPVPWHSAMVIMFGLSPACAAKAFETSNSWIRRQKKTWPAGHILFRMSSHS